MRATNETHPCAPNVGAIVVAAGESRRMQGIDKIFYPLNGVPLVLHSISVLWAHPLIGRIVLVTSKRNIEQAQDLIAAQHPGGSISVCEGGDRRQDSVRLGLERLEGCDLVVVHDGARPFISQKLLERGISAVHDGGAAIAAVPVKDTIKQSDGGDIVARTIPRDKLRSVQTPQIFGASLLKEAHQQVRQTVTDDASMVEAMGHPVKLFFGSYYNIKITTPEDLTFAQAIISLRADKNCKRPE